MNNLKVFLLLIVLLLSYHISVLSGIPTKGRPFIKYYAPSDYGAGSNVNNVIRDSNGVFYFSNSEGVLLYDGVEWNLIPIKDNKPVYWIDINNEGVVLVASTGEIGYLDYDTNGKKIYKSLLTSSPDLEFENVWEIASTNNESLFRSRKLLISYRDKKIKVIVPEGGGFDVAFKVNDTIYTRDRGLGLQYLSNGKLMNVAGGEFFADTKLNCYLPYDDKLLVGRRTGELYLLSNGNVEEFHTEADDFLNKYHIYDACVTQSGDYAFGTTLDGIVIINKEGKLLQILNKDSGLPSYQVAFVGEAGPSSLWITHAVGMSRAEILSPLSYFNDSHGINDMVTDIIIHEGNLYITTLKGFFQFDEKNNKFLKINKKFNQEFHSLIVRDNKLLIGGQDGLMVLNQGQLSDLIDLTIYQMAKSSDKKMIYTGSGEGGFDVIKKYENEFENYHLDGFTEQVKKIVPLKNKIALVSLFGKLLLVDLTIENERLKLDIGDEIKLGNFDAININGKLIVISSKGWFDYDLYDESQPFQEFSYPINISNIQITSETIGDNFWICYKDDKRIDHCEKWVFRNNELTSTKDRFKPGYHIRTIFRGEDGIDWFGGDEGVLRYDGNIDNQNEVDSIYCYISHTVLNGEEKLTNYEYKPENFELPYSGNSLQFSFYTNRSFESKNEILFQYKLEGLDNGWSKWSSKPTKEYSNLRPDDYIFHVRAKNDLGNISNIDSQKFEIVSPWYFSTYGFIGYGMVFILISYSYTRWRTNNIKQSKKKLEKLIQGRTIEVELQKQAIEEQKEVLQQADATKNQLLSIVGHDLRGPLNSIQGLTELIKHYRSEKRPEKVDELMGHMSDSVKRLSHLLDNLLSWALNQSGNFQLRKEDVNLKFLINEVVGIFKETANSKKTNIIFNVDEKLTLYADRNSLGTVLRNLVSNAIKFTHENGKVSIKTIEKENRIVIEISDDGVGIAKEKISKIFQLANTSFGTSNEKGTGLGLVLVEEFVQLNGGELSVESELEQGTTFSLSFPLNGNV